MANQQGQRSQNDPNAAQNQGNQQSNQSSEQAQHMGSIDEDRSVQSGLPGIPSQMHAGADRADDLEDQVNTTMSSGMGQNRPGENQGGSNHGTARTDKHGQSRVDNGTGMGTEQDRDASTGSRRNN
ncbi:hypothetical protein [Hymenobacter sp. CRA2]|uniref:hypothetical protein n=1 Tax=Hymenobacter sp. CRA2 TaxID=1955620 RepID=UPI00098EBC85|nr:hypothetical protein [Hymenobacter sp. CRA2]OON68585.1 hypothetical protein B0919_13175 [Hymenobacter sp. CRA2]